MAPQRKIAGYLGHPDVIGNVGLSWWVAKRASTPRGALLDVLSSEVAVRERRIVIRRMFESVAMILKTHRAAENGGVSIGPASRAYGTPLSIVLDLAPPAQMVRMPVRLCPPEPRDMILIIVPRRRVAIARRGVTTLGLFDHRVLIRAVFHAVLALCRVSAHVLDVGVSELVHWVKALRVGLTRAVDEFGQPRWRRQRVG